MGTLLTNQHLVDRSSRVDLAGQCCMKTPTMFHPTPCGVRNGSRYLQNTRYLRKVKFLLKNKDSHKGENRLVKPTRQ